MSKTSATYEFSVGEFRIEGNDCKATVSCNGELGSSLNEKLGISLLDLEKLVGCWGGVRYLLIAAHSF